MKRAIITVMTIFLSICITAQSLPKREFRGAWIHTVGNEKIKTMEMDSVKALFCKVLDIFKSAGINAVIFQVRPQADAFYKSELEPWSRFLSGNQGVAPNPEWDPLSFMIEECHKRGMELHAWCNPYRVTSNDKEQLHPSHLYFKKPEIFKRYGTQLYFDPGEPESINHTVRVIADIVSRYDVDAIHFDDYFYPYPIKFEEFHDDQSFVKYAKEQGFEYWQKGDWRRNNVATLIKRLNDTIKAIKPWVRFGISPFGIHRNLKDTPDGSGSNTNGLSNYEQLFADVPSWIEKGWIDYNVPQLYWEIGHPAADYKTLIEWWSKANFGGQLYIGQNISSFSKMSVSNPKQTQFKEKMNMVRELPNIHGNVWWPGWSLLNNLSFTDSLKMVYQKTPSLIPAYNKLDSIAPDPITKIRKRGDILSWSHSSDDPMQKAFMYITYISSSKDATPNSNEATIVEISPKNEIDLKVLQEKSALRGKFYYFITVVDRCWNESKASRPILVRHR